MSIEKFAADMRNSVAVCACLPEDEARPLKGALLMVSVLRASDPETFQRTLQLSRLAVLANGTVTEAIFDTVRFCETKAAKKAAAKAAEEEAAKLAGTAPVCRDCGLRHGIGQSDEPFDRRIYEVLQRVNQKLEQIGLPPLHTHGSEGIVPHYSTDLLAAGRVIEQLRPRTLVLRVYTDNRIQATFDEASGLDGIYTAESTGEYIVAQATAICLAALKLRGQQGVSSG